MKKLALRVLLISALSISFHFCVNAQPPDGDPDPDEIPLDPGSWVLVAAGVGYGVKKWKDSRRQIKTDSENPADFIQEDENNQNF